jgi:spectrin beta
MILVMQGDIGHDLTTINLLLGKHKTLETEILGHESTLQVR